MLKRDSSKQIQGDALGWLDKARREREQEQKKGAGEARLAQERNQRLLALEQQHAPIIELRLREVGEFYYPANTVYVYSQRRLSDYFGSDRDVIWGVSPSPRLDTTNYDGVDNCAFWIRLVTWSPFGEKRDRAEFQIGHTYKCPVHKFSDKTLKGYLGAFANKGMPCYHKTDW